MLNQISGRLSFREFQDYGEFHHQSYIYGIIRKQIPDPIKTILALRKNNPESGADYPFLYPEDPAKRSDSTLRRISQI